MHGDGGIEKLWRQIGDKIDTQISWPWKHFFASKIVLRVIVCCLRGVGSMSYPSIHRTVFHGAPLAAYLTAVSRHLSVCTSFMIIIMYLNIPRQPNKKVQVLKAELTDAISRDLRMT